MEKLAFHRPFICVCGMGRCGQTMMMHILAAGGIDCFGEAPAYEPDPKALQERARTARDMAGKFVWPANTFSEIGILYPALVIWCRRNYIEQARSHAKMQAAAGLHRNGRPPLRAIKKMRDNIRNDTQAFYAELGNRDGLELRSFHFERMIEDPLAEITRLMEFLGRTEETFDIDAACAAVHKRDAKCLPELAELKMIDDG